MCTGASPRSRTVTPCASVTNPDDGKASVTDDNDDEDMGGDDVNPDASAAARSPQMQQSLVARSNLDPRAVNQLRSALYAGAPSEENHARREQSSIPPFRQGVMGAGSHPISTTPAGGSLEWGSQGSMWGAGAPSSFQKQGSKSQAEPRAEDSTAEPGLGKTRRQHGPGMTVWKKPAVPILPPTTAGA